MDKEGGGNRVLLRGGELFCCGFYNRAKLIGAFGSGWMFGFRFVWVESWVEIVILDKTKVEKELRAKPTTLGWLFISF